MKSKSKKAEKKKVVPSKTDETVMVAGPATAPVESKALVEIAPALTSEAPPMEAVMETLPVTAPVKKEERRVISSEERQRLISLAAYYRAQRTGFGKTNPVEDWLLAEREVDAMIASRNAN